MHAHNFRKAARRVRAGIVAVPLLAGACQLPMNGGTVCTAQFVYGISATVSDAATGADITPGSSLIVREGGYVDSVAAGPGSFLAAAGERSGTYDVSIRRPGYSSFSQTGVVVTKNECHVNPVGLKARLLRTS